MIRYETRGCRTCGTLAAVPVSRVNHVMHLLLTIITMGAWLPIWVVLAIWSSSSLASRAQRCHHCGGRV